MRLTTVNSILEELSIISLRLKVIIYHYQTFSQDKTRLKVANYFN